MSTTDTETLDRVRYSLHRFLEVQATRPDRFVIWVSPDLAAGLLKQLEQITEVDDIPVMIHYSAIMRPGDGALVMAERPVQCGLS